MAIIIVSTNITTSASFDDAVDVGADDLVIVQGGVVVAAEGTGARGIDAGANGGVTALISGTVASQRSDGIFVGSFSNSAAGNNSVTVHEDGLIYAGIVGIRAHGPGSEVNNAGTLTGANGIYMALSESQGNLSATISNTGTIDAEGFGIKVRGAGSNVSNAGSVNASGDGLYAFGTGHSFFNSGTVQSFVTNGVLFAGNGDNSLTNTGTIRGNNAAIEDAGAGSLTVDTATGTIYGGIDFEGGDDTLIVRQKNPDGLLDADGGDGSDTIDLSGYQAAATDEPRWPMAQ